MIVVFLLVFSFKTVNSKIERPRISRNNRKSFFTSEAVKPREPFFHGPKKLNRANLDSRRTSGLIKLYWHCCWNSMLEWFHLTREIISHN